MTTPKTTAPTASREVLSAFDYERGGWKANE
jgi:hypothetical protein